MRSKREKQEVGYRQNGRFASKTSKTPHLILLRISELCLRHHVEHHQHSGGWDSADQVSGNGRLSRWRRNDAGAALGQGGHSSLSGVRVKCRHSLRGVYHACSPNIPTGVAESRQTNSRNVACVRITEQSTVTFSKSSCLASEKLVAVELGLGNLCL